MQKSQSLQESVAEDTELSTLTSATAPSVTASSSAESCSTAASATPASTNTSRTAMVFDVNKVQPIATITVGHLLREPFKQLKFKLQ
ncbi:hypothetical protein BG004_003465 [Podila humilis]|nr:hypothetical protein BG004_003465 [Podila humilis]